MLSVPTPEQSARHLLDIFAHAHDEKLRAGQVLSRGPAKIYFLKDGSLPYVLLCIEKFVDKMRVQKW